MIIELGKVSEKTKGGQPGGFESIMAPTKLPL